MRNLFFIAAYLMLIPSLCLAQDKGKDKDKENVIDAKGDMYFNGMCYTKALGEYMKAYTKRPDDPKLLKRIAETIISDESPRGAACIYIDRYLKMVPDQDIDAYYIAAKAHFHAHDFSQAKKYLDEFATMAKTQEDQAKADELGDWIKSAQAMVKDSLNCTFINMGEMINTQYSEINPYIINNNSTLIFSSDDKYNSTIVMNYFNVKVSDTQGLGWSKSKPATGVVNTIYDEYVCGTNANGMFFNSNREGEFAIYECDKYMGNGRMSDGLKLTSPIDMKGHEVAATSSLNGDTIIFSGTCTNDKLDLFYSIKFNGVWCTPRPLPGLVNTEEFDENYPNLSADGKRLYFSSDRPGSMGGLDLYYSDLNTKTGEWGKPVHMKYPINDTYDNMTISYTSDHKYAYISSIREGGFGGRDIYAVVFDKYKDLKNTALLKYTVAIKAKPKPMPLTEQPTIEVTDETGETVASIKMKMSTSTFVLTLDPGVYTLTIESDRTKPYTEKLVVSEKYYNPQVPIEKIVVLDPQ